MGTGFLLSHGGFRAARPVGPTACLRRRAAVPAVVRMCDGGDVDSVGGKEVGRILEVMRNGSIQIGVIQEELEGSYVVNVVGPDGKMEEGPQRVPEGEIVCIWREEPSVDSRGEVEAVVAEGKRILQNAPSRALNLDPLCKEMQVLGKKASRTSLDIASYLFPSLMKGTRRGAARVAASLLVGNDRTRFKRGAPAEGHYALPQSVVDTRARADFVVQAQQLLEKEQEYRTSFKWSRPHLHMIRNIEMCAASETAPNKTVGSILTQLGFEASCNGAREALIALGFRSEDQLSSVREKSDPLNTDDGTDDEGSSALDPMDASFPQNVLTEARKAFEASWNRRHGYADGSLALWKDQRRIEHDIYCVDEFRTKFYDDAVSTEVVDSSTTRVYVHVADVDATVRANGDMDRVALERGESMYLPNRPFHMIPPVAMEAASFSPVLAGEALSVAMDVNVETGELGEVQVFRSVLRPIVRVTYDQLNEAMTNRALSETKYPAQWVEDLERLGKVTKALMKKRESAQKRPRDSDENRKIAGVRLVGGKNKKIEITDFKKTLAHGAIDELLTVAGEQLREFARQRKCPLPERKGAELFARRCGTAPLRRYVDLAIQRQIKTVLINQQMPAGRRRMAHLCAFLEKRHVEVQDYLKEQRKSTLLTSLAEQCADERAAGVENAVLDAKIVTMKRKRIILSLLGTGLTATATIADNVEGAVRGAKVRARITNINMGLQEITAEVIGVSVPSGPREEAEEIEPAPVASSNEVIGVSVTSGSREEIEEIESAPAASSNATAPTPIAEDEGVPAPNPTDPTQG